VKAAFQLTDVLPTILEATGASYPTQHNGEEIVPYQGRSLLPALRGEPTPDGTLYWEHTGNAAIRRGAWKLVRDYPQPWELYDLSRDRSELNNLADKHPEVVLELSEAWQTWATRVGVIPWEVTLNLYAERGQPQREALG
jgi:arylsulfatase A-like enzyme